MVAISADDVPLDRTRRNLAKARKRLAVLALLGILSFAAVSDQSQERPPECGPFTIGVSPLGGCDWLL
jgi:hypothetical protein